MDFLFIGAIAAFAIVIWAMAAGCDKLGGQQ
ncbi:MAG: potassium ABC transporter ATPase [Duganella sp.]